MAKKSKDTIAGISPFNEAKYRAQSDLSTLLEAEEINKDPKRLKAARVLAKERVTAMKTVAAEK